MKSVLRTAGIVCGAILLWALIASLKVAPNPALTYPGAKLGYELNAKPKPEVYSEFGHTYQPQRSVELSSDEDFSGDLY